MTEDIHCVSAYAKRELSKMSDLEVLEAFKAAKAKLNYVMADVYRDEFVRREKIVSTANKDVRNGGV